MVGSEWTFTGGPNGQWIDHEFHAD